MKVSKKTLAEWVDRLGPAAAQAVRDGKGVNVPGFVRPSPAPPAPPVLADPETVIAEFLVDALPVPWRAPTGGRVRITPAHVKAWKRTVAVAADRAGFGQASGIPPYAGPVRLELWVCRKAPAGFRPGDRMPRRPDWDNYAKGIGDAISGNVFRKNVTNPDGSVTPARLSPPSPVGRILADDNVVTDAVVRKRYWSRPLAFVRVVAVSRTDPGPFPFSLPRNGEQAVHVQSPDPE